MFRDRVSLIPGWPWTGHGAEDYFQLSCLQGPSAGIAGMCYHTQFLWSTLLSTVFQGHTMFRATVKESFFFHASKTFCKTFQLVQLYPPCRSFLPTEASSRQNVTLWGTASGPEHRLPFYWTLSGVRGQRQLVFSALEWEGLQFAWGSCIFYLSSLLHSGWMAFRKCSQGGISHCRPLIATATPN